MRLRRRRRRQTLPALLLGPMLIALLIAWRSTARLAHSLKRTALSNAPRTLPQRIAAAGLAASIVMGSMVLSGGQPASAATITYGGHLGSGSGASCSAPPSQVTSNDDNHVDESQPTTVLPSNHLDVHVHSETGRNERGFIKFPMPAIPANCRVGSAILELEVETFTAGRTIQVQRAASAWTETTVTWNNQPGVTGPITTAPSDTPDVTVNVTSQVTDIYSDANHGFRIRDASENAATAQRNEFYSKDNGSLDPQLTISWASLPQSVTQITVGGAGVAAGDSVIVSFGMADTGAGTVAASDSVGNVYSVDASATNVNDVRSVILSAHDVTPLPPGSTITVTHPPSAYRGATANGFSGISPTTPRDASATGQGSNAAPSTGSAATTQPDELVFSSVSAADPTFTPGGGYIGLPAVSSPVGSMNSQYKIVSSAGSYVGNGTLGSPADWAATVATYRMDMVAPSVVVTQPGNGTSTSDATPTISGTSGSFNSDSQTVTVEVYDGPDTSGTLLQTLNATRAANGNWSIDAAALPEGLYTIQASQTDGAGNIGTSFPSTFTVDSSLPSAPTFDSTPGQGSSTTPSWSFSGEPGASFECRLEKDAVEVSGWAACTSPHQYTLVDGDGTYTISVRQIDAAMNVSPAATDDYILDTVIPETTIDSGPTGTTGNADASFTFSSDDPLATFECQLDGGGFASCTSPVDLVGLADGPHTFQVRAVDPVGNPDATPAENNFTVDTSLPSEPTLNGPAQDPDDDDTPTWDFGGEPGATFECKLEKDGVQVSDWTICTSPQTPTLTGDGTYTFSVRQTDGGGNVSAVATDDYELDTADPAVPSLTGPDPDPGRITTPQWTFNGEATATFECKLEKGAVVISDWTTCISPESPTLVDGDGVYTFSVRQTDEAGNVSAVSTDTYDLDATVPDTTIDSGPSGTITATDASFTFSSPDATAVFECQFDTGGFAPCTSPQDFTGLADGSHVFEARAVDPVGNVDPSPAAGNFVVDTQAPVAPGVTDPSPNPGTDDMPSWSFTGEPGATFECKLEKDGVVLSDWASCGSPVSYLLSDGDGTYTVHVRQIDAGGNVSPAMTSDYDLDTSAPSAPAITGPDPNPGNVSIPAWDFSGEPGASFECKLEKDGVELVAYAPCGAPQMYALSDGDGDYVFTVRQTDAAGNVSPGASDTYTFDTAAPDTVIDSGPTGTVATADIDFTFSSADPTATFQCDMDGSGFTSCSSPQNYSSLSDGDHTFRVRAVDEAGNPDGTPAEQTFTSDTQAPPLSIDSRPSDPGNDASPTWTYSSTEPGVAFECELSDSSGVVSPWTPCDSGSITYDLSSSPDDTYTFKVRVTDAVGNSAVRTDTYLFDTTDPDSAAIAPAASGATAVTVNYSSDDGAGSGIAEVELWVRGPQDAGFVLVATDTTPASPSFDYTADQGDGVYRFYTRALDAAGNRQAAPGGAQAQTDVDLTAPVVTITGGPSPEWTSTDVTYTFTIDDPSATAECSLTNDGSESWGPCTSPASYTIADVGDYEFQVRAVDAVGNVSAPTTDTFSYSEPSPEPEPEPSTPSPDPSTPSPDPTTPSPDPTPDPDPTTPSPDPTTPSPDPTNTKDPEPTPTKDPDPTPSPDPDPTPTETPPPPTGGGSGPSVHVPIKDGDTTDERKDDPVDPPGGRERPRIEEPVEPNSADESKDETEIERLGRYAAEAVQRFAFPLILALAVVAFLAVQHWLDRKTPKLAFAPVHSQYDKVGFE
ncbi:MAG: Ig-like domain-containing protein [Actinomycetota bacterium]